MVELNTTLINSDNTVKAVIINLSGFDILFSPYGGNAEVKIPYQTVPTVIDDNEVLYLDIQGATVPVCERISQWPLKQQDNVFYVVKENVKKAYKDRDDVLVIGTGEGFDKNGYLIVRKLYL